MRADWTTTIQDPAALEATFTGSPPAAYRPVPMWWWSGEELDEERLLWQADRIADLGCGAALVTGLALHGNDLGTAADRPLGYTDPWLRLHRAVAQRLHERGLGLFAWSFVQSAHPRDTHALLQDEPALAALQVVGGAEVEPFGFDLGSRRAMDRLTGGGTLVGGWLEHLARLRDDVGDVVVGLFEDELPALPRWWPAADPDLREALVGDVGPATPALRCRAFEAAVERTEGAYTDVVGQWVGDQGVLAGYDQMHRTGTPLMSAVFALDPFRTMAWANAPGTDQMGDARFAASLPGARVLLEGFHSHGWGMTLDHQLRLLHVWAREGASLFIPHGCYYANRALWWEWASPEMCFKQPFARHYPAFAEAVGRLMLLASAGVHDPDVAVLFPLRTAWAGTEGPMAFTEDALRAERCWALLFGVHDAPSSWEPGRARLPSLLARAGYDRVALDERAVGASTLPVVVPGARCLPTATLEALVRRAEAGDVVVVVEPVPEWSAEVGREDAAFRALADRLRAAATVVAEPEDVVSSLPPPRIEGAEAQWRRVGDLRLAHVEGGGPVRLRGMAGGAVERWDVRTGRRWSLEVTVAGDDVVVEVPAPGAVLTFPMWSDAPREPGSPLGAAIPLPTTWDIEHLPWGENRWGDLRLPSNPGTPPVERRTFAHREGDDDRWRRAPVVPEDVEHPMWDVGFETHMRGETGRVHHSERRLPDGWHEVVSTYGARATVDGRLVEWSERLGVEDLVPSTSFGLRGRVDPVKVDLGPSGTGTVTSWGLVEQAGSTHLVVEATAIVTVSLDGERVLGPVDAGVVSIPVELEAGWHRVDLLLEPRAVAAPRFAGYRPADRTQAAWSFCEPYRRPAVGVWGGQIWHPDYKGSPGARAFRRRVTLPEPADVRISTWATGGAAHDVPDRLPAGEHVIEITAGGGPAACACFASIELVMASGTVTLTTDERWETRAAHASRDPWLGAFEPGHAELGAPVPEGQARLDQPRRHPLLDVSWLEGPESALGHRDVAWADDPAPPPPAWFCFTAPPGARRMSLPIVGEVQAWADGEPVALDGESLPLRERQRVALRVQAPAGRRGAACFTEHPVLDLGAGTIDVGTSWHRQGLDAYAGVILHTAVVDVDERDAGPAVLDLGEVIGSVAVRIDGDHVGTLVSAPWTLDVILRPGANRIQLEVAGTLGPLAGRGVPTPYGPEDQRRSGVLGTPSLTSRSTR